MKKSTNIAVFIGLYFFIGHSVFAQPFDCEEELFSKKDKQTRLFGYVNMLGEYRIPPTFLKALPYSGKYAVVQQGKKFGVINCEGVLVVPADYDEIASFINGKGWMKMNGKWGLVDGKGRVLIQPQYEDVQEVNTFSGTVTWVKKNDMWGLINRENGRMLVNPQFETYSSISDSAGIGRRAGLQDLVYYGDGRIIIGGMRQVKKVGAKLFIYQHENRQFGVFNSLAFITVRPNWDTIFLNQSFFQVKKDGLFGLLNVRGTEIFPVEYSQISQGQGAFFGLVKDKQFTVLDVNGKKHSPEGQFSSGSIFGSNWVHLQKGESGGIWNLKNQKWELPFQNQIIRISKSTNWVEVRRNGESKVWYPDLGLGNEIFDSLQLEDRDLIRVFKGGKVGLISKNSQPPSEWFDKMEKSENGRFLIDVNGKWGIVNSNGVKLVSPEFENITVLKGNGFPLAYKVKKTGKTGLLDESGKWALLADYDDIRTTVIGARLVKLNGRWGLLDQKEKWIIEAKLDSFQVLKSNGDLADFPILAWKKGKGQLLSDKGEELSEPSKNEWKYLEADLWAMKDENGWHLYNKQGRAQGNIAFEEILLFSEGNAPVKQGGKWGFVNAFGRLVIPAHFEAIMPYQNGIAFARLGGKWGVLKKNGSWLVKPIGLGVYLDENGKRKLQIP